MLLAKKKDAKKKQEKQCLAILTKIKTDKNINVK